MEPVISLRGVHFSYPSVGFGPEAGQTPILRGVDLDVEAGEMTCLVGPSGSGKTTLLNLMGLLEPPQKGDLRFLGRSVHEMREADLERCRLAGLGFVFQAFFLVPTLTALENTTYFLSILGLNRAESLARGEEALEQVGLLEHRRKLPRDLSGGQRQRVAIARALAKRPRVILADEPTANLDRETAQTIIEVFQELREKQKVSFVFSTHDPHLVGFAGRVFELRDGRLVAAAGRARESQ